MAAAPAWLAEKAKSYYRDAERLEGEAQVGDMTGAQWATVYRAVAEGLKACARGLGES